MAGVIGGGMGGMKRGWNEVDAVCHLNMRRCLRIDSMEPWMVVGCANAI